MREYNHKIAEEIAIYILQKGKLNDAHRLFMFLYLADKLHLQKYGCFMFDEVYRAGSEGPIPSIVEKFIKKIRAENTNNLYFKKDILICERDFDLDHISDASKECINTVLKNETPPLSAYKDAAWNNTELGSNINLIHIASTLSNANELIPHLKDPYPEIEVAKNVQKPCAR